MTKVQLPVFKSSLLFCLSLICSIGALTGVSSAGKISPSNVNVSLTEGTSQTVQLQLDAPIICPGSPAPPTCDVELTFISSDPSQVSVSPTPVIWNYNEWSQVRLLTITALDDGVYSGDRNITLSATAVSNAVYYTNYAINISTTVHNIDPAPIVAPASSSSAPAPSTSATLTTPDTGYGKPVSEDSQMYISTFVAIATISLSVRLRKNLRSSR